jgi:uncharacterized protein (DUF433 family)
MATKQFSLRIDTSVLEELDRQARESGETRTALAERLLDEGLRREKHPLIWFREDGPARRPRLIGTRLDVWQVIETIRQNDNSVAEAAEYLDRPISHIEACVAYYADYKEEIDEWTARAYALADAAETEWLRQQQLLA